MSSSSVRNGKRPCSISWRISCEGLLNLSALVGREQADFGEHLGVGDRAFDILRIEPAVEAHALGELLDAAVRRLIEYAAPRFFSHRMPPDCAKNPQEVYHTHCKGGSGGAGTRNSPGGAGSGTDRFAAKIAPSIEKRPKIGAEQMVDRLDMRSEQRIGLHIGADVAIVHPIERVQLDRVSLEVAGEESCTDAKLVLLPRLLPLHVVEKDSDVGMSVSARRL